MGGGDQRSWTVTVNPADAGNHDPVIDTTSLDDPTAGRQIQYQIEASDEDDDKLRYLLVANDPPSGATIDRDTGVITWTPSAAGTVDIDVKVYDGRGGSDIETFTVSVQAPPQEPQNNKPIITTTASDSVVAGELYKYDAHATDDDSDTLTWDKAFGPDALWVDDKSGEVYWDTERADIGVHQVVLRVSDGHTNGTDVEIFYIEVIDDNTPPDFKSVPYGPAGVGELWTYEAYAEDVNPDTLTYSLDFKSLQRGMTINKDTGLIEWTPGSEGFFPVVVTVVDGRGGKDVQGFDLEVTDNSPPSLVIAPSDENPATYVYNAQDFVVPVGEEVTYKLHLADLDDDVTQITPIIQAEGTTLDGFVLNYVSSVDSDTDLYHLVGIPGTVGEYKILLRAEDGESIRTLGVPFLVYEPTAPNEGPEFLTKPKGPATINRQYVYDIELRDPDGDGIASLTLNQEAIDRGVQFETPYTAGDTTARLIWTPTSSEPVYIELTATDDRSSGAAGTVLDYTLDVFSNNAPEVYLVPAGYGGTVSAYDYDPDDFTLVNFANNGSQTLSFKLIGIDPDTGETATLTPTLVGDRDDITMTATATDGEWDLVWTPDAAGLTTVRVKVLDIYGAGQEVEFELLAKPATNTAPRLDGEIRSELEAGNLFTAQLIAVDDDGDEVTFSLKDDPRDAPADMYLSSNGLLTWQTELADFDPEFNPYEFTIVLDDSNGGVVEVPLELTLRQELINQAPYLDPINIPVATVGELYTLPLTATDIEKDYPLHWSVSGEPDDLDIDEETGLIDWTPTENQLGSHTFNVTVADYLGKERTEEITIKVASVNLAPKVVFNPVTKSKQGDPYSSPIQVTDPNGDELDITVVAMNRELTPQVVGDFDVIEDPSKPGTGHYLITWEWDGDEAQHAPFDIEVTVTDGEYIVTRDYTLTFDATGIDDKPEVRVTNNPSQYASVGNPYVVEFEVTDADTDLSTIAANLVKFTSSRLDAGSTSSWDGMTDLGVGDLTIAGDVLSGTISWTPVSSDADISDSGIHQIQFYVTDGTTPAGLSFNVTVVDIDINDQTTIDNATVDVLEGKPFEFDAWPLVNSTPGVGVMFELSDLHVTQHEGIAIDPYTGVITWDAQSDLTGLSDVDFTVNVIDQYGYSDSATITLNAISKSTHDGIPTISLDKIQTLFRIGDSKQLNVKVTDDLGIQHVKIEIKHEGVTLVDGGNMFRAGGNPEVYFYNWDFNQLGSYYIKTTVTDTGDNTATDEYTVQVVQHDSHAPVPEIVSYQEAGENSVSWANDGVLTLTSPITVYGTVLDADEYALYQWMLHKPNDPEFSLALTEPATLDGEEYIYTQLDLDVTSLANGLYQLDLIATDTRASISDGRLIEINSDMKLGNFNVSFDDLVIPLAGVPVTVQRGYDTLDAASAGDFGYGWSLDILTVGVQSPRSEVVEPYSGIMEAWRFGDIFPVRMPDGSTEQFQLLADIVDPSDSRYGKAANSLAAIGGTFVQPRFQSLSSYATLELTHPEAVSQLDDGRFVNYGIGASGDGELGQNYNPASSFSRGGRVIDYILTTEDQMRYVIDGVSGEIKESLDLAGNKLVIDQDQIAAVDHDGNEIAKVSFTRDKDTDFITIVEDARGEKIYYDYDDDGNLVKVTNRVGDVTRLHYLDGVNDPEHFLYKIETLLDPQDEETGYDVFSVGFDENNRVSGITDASGKSADFEYSIDRGDGTYIEKVDKKDEATGDGGDNDTELVRDNNGNVIRSIRFVYSDTLDNEPDAYVFTDYVYNDKNQLLTEYQPLRLTDTQVNTELGLQSGKDIYTFVLPAALVKTASLSTYYAADAPNDQGGKLRTTTDAEGNTTTYGYYPYDKEDGLFGGLEYVIDSANGVTRYTYNDFAKISSVTDAEKNKTYYDYDEAGRLTKVRQVTKQGVETVVSMLDYDDRGYLKSSTNTSERTTYFINDVMGNQTHSWYSVDGKTLVSVTDYDGEGRVVGSAQFTIQGQAYGGSDTDRGLVEAAAPSDSSEWSVTEPDSYTTTDYDSRGLVVQTRGQYGSITTNVYDIRGLLIRTISQSYDDVADDTVNIVTDTVYDDLGRVIFATDPYLDTNEDGSPDTTIFGTRTLYDDQGRVYQTERYEGAQITFGDDPGNSLFKYTQITESGGVPQFGTMLSSSTTVFDDYGRVSSTTNQLGATTYYEYDDAGRQTAVIGPAIEDPDPNSSDIVRLRTETVYDDAGRQHIVRTNIKQSTTADPGNPPEANSDRTAQTEVFYEYDKLGRQVATISAEIEDPDDLGSGNMVRLRTETVYDDLGRRSELHENLKQSGVDNVDRSKARITTYEYDDAGRLSAVNLPAIVIDNPADPGNDITVQPRYEYRYDAFGNQTSITDNAYLYDGNVVYMEKNSSGVDAIYSVTPGTVPDRSTVFEYDHFNRQTSRTLPEGQEETFHYDDTPIADVQGDANPELSVGAGQLEYHVSFEGVVTAYRYDNRSASGGRLVQKLFFDDLTGYSAYLLDPVNDPADQTVTYTYDAFGRQVQVVDSLHGTTSNEYDEQGRLTEIDSPEGIVHHRYNDLGQLERTWTGDTNASDDPGTPGTPDTETAYTYDTLGRLGTVTQTWRGGSDITDETTSYGYDLIGNLDYTELPNGVVSDYIYDAMNRLDALYHFVDLDADHTYDDGTETLLSSYDYTVNLAGLRTAVTEIDDSDNQVDITWTYDALNRLTEEVRDLVGATSQGDYVDKYTYDLVGNRLSNTHYDNYPASGTPEVITYYYDDNDRLTEERLDTDGTAGAEETTRYSYDGTQQATKSHFIGDPDTPANLNAKSTFSYNLQGRLEQVKIDLDGDGIIDQTLTYAYNDDGIRVSQTVDDGSTTTTTTYVIDGSNPTGYAQVLEEWVDGDGAGGAPAAYNIGYTLGHDVIGNSYAGTPGTMLYLLADGHGSTRQINLHAAPGSVFQRYAYDAYGNMLKYGSLFGNTSGLADTLMTSHLYSGEQTDALTGMQYLRARYYDPSTGRFNRVDPFAGNTQDPQSLHKYAYAHANPVMGVDPSGLFSINELNIANSIRNLLTSFYDGVLSGAIAAVEGAEAGLNAQQAAINYLIDTVLAPVEVVVGVVSLLMDTIEQGAVYIMTGGVPQPISQASAPTSGLALVAAYKSLKTKLGYQRHHLNQVAAFKQFGHSKSRGASTYLSGNVNTPGSEHWHVHLELERMWEPHRINNTRPSINEYNRALSRGLLNAGLDRDAVAGMVRAARIEQARLNLTGTSRFRDLPGRINSLIRWL